ncbi:MAG: transglycosylase domain-containing protein [Candidatus Roizmanbacteria bacterium]
MDLKKLRTSMSKKITKLLYKLLYYIVWFFISIGESVQRVITITSLFLVSHTKRIYLYINSNKIIKVKIRYVNIFTFSQVKESSNRLNEYRLKLTSKIRILVLIIKALLKKNFYNVRILFKKLVVYGNSIQTRNKGNFSKLNSKYIKGSILKRIIEIINNSSYKKVVVIVRKLFGIVLFIVLIPIQVVRAILSERIRSFYFGFFVCFLLLSTYQSYIFIKGLPSPEDIGKVNYPVSSHIFDRNGKLLYEVFREQNRTPVKLKDIPKYLFQASISIEDKDFYKHHGVSLISGILRALVDTVKTKELQGGSTITQQLVKTALLSPEQTIDRKIKEIILAIWTERIYSKEEILQMYLNQVPYGGSAYGVEEASKTYLGKSAKELTIAEAAMLAGLPQAPSIYSPFSNPDAAIYRRNEVLNKMFKQGYITEKQYQSAQKEKIKIIPPVTSINAPHFVFFVKSQLEKEYGIREVEEGGLRVTTSLDLDVQNEVQKILKEEIEKIKGLNVSNGAVIVTKPETGEILAMVGSIDYFAEPNGAFNVTTALRQPGSTIKVPMYALALEKGYTSATILEDAPISFNIPGSVTYRPVNYDGKFHGRIPLRYALANSYNIPAVKTLNAVGVENFVTYAQKLGISTWNDPSRFGLSLTLGGGEVTMLDISKAFGVFASEGYRVELNPIKTLDDAKNSKIYQSDVIKTKVVDSSIAYIISDMLSDDVARQWAFGANSFLNIKGYKASVKTGTTDSKKDNWTIGYTPEYLVTVWVGNNDNTPMNPALTSGITGAAPIWNRVMTYLLKRDTKPNVSQRWFVKPPNVVEKNCYFGRREVFVAGTDKTTSCGLQLFLSPQPTIQN